jgi:predicted negative regulator of RcsB-dependent stress response
VEDLSEKEQIEAVRSWWSENGNFVIGGIVVGVAIIFGWNSWQANIAHTEIAASTLFEDVMDSAGRGRLDPAVEAGEALFRDYNDTAYADQARLALARMYMDSGRDQNAADVLEPLANETSGDELALVARLRLAKILLYQDKADEVIALIDGQPESAFSARFNEVLGDAYVAAGRYEEAEAAYIAALNDNPVARTVDIALIQLKINDLPVPGEEGTETDSGVVDPADLASGESETTDDATRADSPPGDESGEQ